MTDYYCDGAGWNGKVSKIAIVNGSNKTIMQVDYHKKFSNNETEYMAVLSACLIAEPGDTIYTDSQLVVNQIHGNWKCNEAYLHEFRDLIRIILEDTKVPLCFVFRNENLAGKLLEKLK